MRVNERATLDSATRLSLSLSLSFSLGLHEINECRANTSWWDRRGDWLGGSVLRSRIGGLLLGGLDLIGEFFFFFLRKCSFEKF